MGCRSNSVRSGNDVSEGAGAGDASSLWFSPEFSTTCCAIDLSDVMDSEDPDGGKTPWGLKGNAVGACNVGKVRT